MLFKALIRRLNGGTDISSTKVSSSHRRSSHLAYQMYPNLPELVLRLLDHGRPELDVSINISTAQGAQKVFAALEVIERSGLPSTHQIDIKTAMWRHASCSNWPIREKAAKTLSLVMEEEDFERECKSVLLPTWLSQNELHGRLLCLRSILSRASSPQVGAMLGA